MAEAIELHAGIESMNVSRDGADYVLGRPDLGIYVAVPEPGAVFIRALQDGCSIAEAGERASAVAGEPVDGADFIAGLTDAGLLAPPASDGGDGRTRRGRRIKWIEGVSPHAAARLFGRSGWTFYMLAAIFVLGVYVTLPSLRPSWESPWFLEDPVLSILVYLPIGLGLGAVHEAWHWLAGRALGVAAVFRVSYRGIYLVFETDLSQLAAIPRRRRYGAFFAGMAIDTVLLAVALGARLLYGRDLIWLPAVVARILGAVVLTQTIGLVWQWAAVFLRSDGYAILANALRCNNLYRATWLTAKRRLFPLSEPEAAELEAIGDRDRQVARWFSVAYMAGLLVMIFMFFNFGLPYSIAMLSWVAHNVTSLAMGTVSFWESFGVLLLIVAQYSLPPYLARRERRLRQIGIRQ